MNPLVTNDSNISLMNAVQRHKSAAQETDKLAQKLNPSKLKKIDESAKEFESVFATEMLKPMFEGLKPNKEFGGGKGEEIFQGMMLDQYGKIMADRGGLGIADAVKGELLRIQAQTSVASTAVQKGTGQ